MFVDVTLSLQDRVSTLTVPVANAREV